MPGQVVVRKYDPDAKTYSTIPGVTITSTTLGGKPALQISYTIEDNGPLDKNPTIGEITDPIGLAVAPGAPNTGLISGGILPNVAAIIAGSALLAAVIITLRRRFYAVRAYH